MRSQRKKFYSIRLSTQNEIFDGKKLDGCRWCSLLGELGNDVLPGTGSQFEHFEVSWILAASRSISLACSVV
jgi:hypothetical protein